MLAIASDLSNNFTSSNFGIAALIVFGLAYFLVVTEDLVKLRKSKPVVMAAGIIWILVACVYGALDQETITAICTHHKLAEPETYSAGDLIDYLVHHHVADFGALFLFLMVAMTYISAIAERNVFLRINAWLVSAGFSLRTVFWTTGLLAFIISPIADNLTTALVMGAVVVTVGGTRMRFIAASCANVVVAANAGGAFSPFGDITTLMVWQEGHVHTGEFLQLVVPSIVNWLVPAFFMSFAVPKDLPPPLKEEVKLKDGWWLVILMFLCTIATAVAFHALLHLPPFLGMTTGLGFFFIYGYWRRMHDLRRRKDQPLDVLRNVAEVEWDTLLFFFGVIMCVGGLREMGYLAIAAEYLYVDMGPFWANVSIGGISAVLDNVPVMFAVLGMEPHMGDSESVVLYQWLLVTLTAGVGGSLLSVGSAAGVALMGTAHGKYTFGSHIKWLPVIALGYAASIYTHHLMNSPAVTP